MKARIKRNIEQNLPKKLIIKAGKKKNDPAKIHVCFKRYIFEWDIDNLKRSKQSISNQLTM